MSDSELDNLFKEAAAGFKAPEDTSAWKSMASKLDQAGIGTSAFLNWKLVSTMAVVGVTGVALVWYALQKDSDKSVAREISSRRPTEVEKFIKSESMEVKSTESSTTSSDQKTKTDIVAIEGINSKNRVVNVEESIGNSKRTVKAISIGVKEQESLIVKSRNQGSSDDSQLPYEIIVVNSESGNGILTENDLDQATTKKPIDVTDNFIAVNDTSNLAAGQKEVFTDSIVSEEVKEILQKKKKLSASIVSIKLAVAPDFSSIKYFTPGKPGLAYGVLVGYSLSNRWSVYTGALSSRKIYSSNNIDKPYTTSGGYPYAVNKLEGDCRVLDIPINFYYTIFPERSFSLKAGIGISSYLMLSEDYVYHVDNPYGPDEYSQNIDRKNNEWFRVMNISLTIQKRLSNQFSIELEPFLKAPLTGVGEGEVSLVSLGAFFNLRFDIPITKSN